jgi:hypothetical protein
MNSYYLTLYSVANRGIEIRWRGNVILLNIPNGKLVYSYYCSETIVSYFSISVVWQRTAS